ncbi:hypothetical protein [Methyloversatilis thermotolerans]|uniref:hypothetical protein n=1 Tax=Methyloversatilis thermotolerans TaxID=1346290 RepID=UPI00036E52C4|nr:hypothetical protein [Methyloversatilis thermotolerans]
MHAEDDNLRFLNAQRARFDAVIAEHEGQDSLPQALLDNAVEHFERALCERLAAETGHATATSCCRSALRATPPEVLSIAHHLRSLDVAQRDALLRRMDAREAERGASCAFAIAGACSIEGVKPLTCRSGCRCGATGTLAHQVVRSLVQDALQAALRDAGYAWMRCELDPALRIALVHPDPLAAWLDGEDVFADASSTDLPPAEIGQTFDWLRRRPRTARRETVDAEPGNEA